MFIGADILTSLLCKNSVENIAQLVIVRSHVKNNKHAENHQQYFHFNIEHYEQYWQKTYGRIMNIKIFVIKKEKKIVFRGN